MYPYQKDQNSLIFDLIKEANPGLVMPLANGNVYFGLPSVQAVPNGGIADTNILAYGKGGYYVGKQRLEYRRIAINNFFKGMTPLEIPLYSPIGPNTAVSRQTLINEINRKFGLTLGANDLTLTGSAAPNAVITLEVLPTSLCYTGTVSFVWRPVAPDVNEVFTANHIDGRLFPTGNNFTANPKPVGQYFCYDLDFTPIAATMNAISTSSTWSNTGNAQAVINFLKANVSTIFDGTLNHTQVGGLNGLPFIKAPMPIVTCPEVNSLHETFKNALVISSLSDSWFQGKMIMHYTP